ncbi:hypothetical protein ARMGADRAFT_1015797 [Armillaria gallica]|uniref:Uncharacterized protein n=1 Tax=Armillaria gallica TaxID=47427 RepID=A0A2H3D091_ARMGA|nr:hypothetical protein ARMGADRAFT_1015797 [Armillaria gallica]
MSTSWKRRLLHVSSTVQPDPDYLLQLNKLHPEARQIQTRQSNNGQSHQGKSKINHEWRFGHSRSSEAHQGFEGSGLLVRC